MFIPFIPPDYAAYMSDGERDVLHETLRKRNAIAYSLQMGKTYREISSVLHVSPKTISKVAKMLKEDE